MHFCDVNKSRQIWQINKILTLIALKQENSMPFSEDDKALIKNFNLFKGYGSRRLLAEFPVKNWTKGGFDTLLKKLKEAGSTDQT